MTEAENRRPDMSAETSAATFIAHDVDNSSDYLTGIDGYGISTSSTGVTCFPRPDILGPALRTSPVEDDSLLGELANADFRHTEEGPYLSNYRVLVYDVPVYIIPGPLSDYPELKRPTVTGKLINTSAGSDTLVKLRIIEPAWDDVGMRVPGEVYLFDRQLTHIPSSEYLEDRNVRAVSILNPARLIQLWRNRLSDIFTAGPFFSGSTMGAVKAIVQGKALPEGISNFYTSLQALNAGVVNPGLAQCYSDWIISLSDIEDISSADVAELPVYYKVHPWIETLILSSMPEHTSIANPHNRLTAYVLPSPVLIPDFNTYRHLGTVFLDSITSGTLRNQSVKHPVSVYRQEGTWRIVILDKNPVLAPTLYLAGLPDKRCSRITHIEMPCLVRYSCNASKTMTIDYRLPPTPHTVPKEDREEALRLDLRTGEGLLFSTAYKWEFPSVSGVYSDRYRTVIADPGTIRVPPYASLPIPDNTTETAALGALLSGLGSNTSGEHPENPLSSGYARPKVTKAINYLRYGEALWDPEAAPEMLFANPPAGCALLDATGTPIYGERPEDVRLIDGIRYTYLLDALAKCPDIGKLILAGPYYWESSHPDEYSLSTLLRSTLSSLKRITGKVVDLEILTDRDLTKVVVRRAERKQEWLEAALHRCGVKPEGRDPAELMEVLLRMSCRTAPGTSLHLKMAVRTRPEWFTTMLTLLSCGEIRLPLKTGSLKKLCVYYF